MSEHQHHPEQQSFNEYQPEESLSASYKEELANLIGKTCGYGKILTLDLEDVDLVSILLAKGQDAFGIKTPGSTLGARFFAGSAAQLPFPDDHFDILVCAGRLESLSYEELPRVLKEICRVTSRYVVLRISTSTIKDTGATVIQEQRAWWESRCFEAGFRKHPLYYRATPYEALNNDGDYLLVLLEKVPPAALQTFDLMVLEEERLLHTDMLRETGRRSDAHCIRYHKAAELIRPGDHILDVACGLGYGSHILYAASQADSIIGVDLSDFGIDYANAHYGHQGKLEFLVGDAQSLEQIPDNSIDFITAFETIEHVPEPLAYLKALKRVLKPSGRIMVCAPNNWADETGEDPNPHHLHVYTWDRLVSEVGAHFLLERGVLQTAGGAMRCHFEPRSWVEVAPDRPLPQDGEWIQLVGMADPVAGRDVPYTETSWVLPSSEHFHVSAFARDYVNPWLVRAMVARGMRATSRKLLTNMQEQTLASSDEDSVDYGAALCCRLYSQLDELWDSPEQTQELEEKARRYESLEQPSPHQLRWQVSLLFVRAEVARLSGESQKAIELYEACAALDVTIYSPLLGNKTLDALHWLAVLAINNKNPEKAKQYLQRAVNEAMRLTSGSWLNVIGSPDTPLPFGFSEMAQLMDKASRAAYMLKVLDDAQGKPGLFHEESHGFFERQLIARDERIRDLEISTQSLLSLVAEKDERLHTLAQEVERMNLRAHELANEVMQQDKHAQALAKEVVRQDEHAQALAREVAQRDEHAQALAREVKQQEEYVQTLAKEVMRQDEYVQMLAKDAMRQDEHAKALAREVMRQDEHAQALAREVMRQDEHAQALAREVVQLDECAQALAREVMQQDEHAQALAREVMQQDEHAQALAREVMQQDEHAQALAREVMQQNEQAQALAREVMQQDEHAQALAREVMQQDEHAQALAREVMQQNEHAQALAREVMQQDEHAQALAREVIQQDEHAQALAREVMQHDEHAQALAREVMRQDERAQVLAREAMRQDELAQTLAMEAMRQEEHAQVLAKQVAQRNDDVQPNQPIADAQADRPSILKRVLTHFVTKKKL